MPGEIDHVFRTLAALEKRNNDPVSAFEVCEALKATGRPIRSYRAMISRLCEERRIWKCGMSARGKNRRYSHVYTAREEIGKPRTRGEPLLPVTIPAELRRAVRDVAAASRAMADALARLDEIIDAGMADATAEQVRAYEKRARQVEQVRRLDERLAGRRYTMTGD